MRWHYSKLTSYFCGSCVDWMTVLRTPDDSSYTYGFKPINGQIRIRQKSTTKTVIICGRFVTECARLRRICLNIADIIIAAKDGLGYATKNRLNYLYFITLCRVDKKYRFLQDFVWRSFMKFISLLEMSASQRKNRPHEVIRHHLPRRVDSCHSAPWHPLEDDCGCVRVSQSDIARRQPKN